MRSLIRTPRTGWALASAILFSALLGPAARAQTHHVECRPGFYGGVTVEAAPYVNNLEAALPRRTSGYAPPCLVADSVAGLIQQGDRRHSALLKHVHPRGARWDGGIFTCAYAVREGEFDFYTHARCVSVRGLVSFNLGS